MGRYRLPVWGFEGGFAALKQEFYDGVLAA
jgi:hypothetical protein